jgi:serine/threonine protein kinase
MPPETNPSPPFASLDPAAARTIDEVCDCFEHRLYTRQAMSIEGLVAGFKEPERSILLRELLLLELERSVSGEARPNIEQYYQRFPQHAAVVQEVFAELFPKAADPKPATLDGTPAIPNYRILRELSQGGMGTVYEAMHTQLGNLVAIKILRPELVRDMQAEVRFKQEMRTIGTLSHPNIVQARDGGKTGSTHYLVMEYLVGFDLADLVQRLGPLPVADACEIARQAALALAHAHQHCLVHRDIKPKNILFGRAHGGDEPVRVKVADFGLALLRGYPRPQDATTSAGIVGTLGYMAPEQYWEQASDIRSDIYSLGCTLYFLLLSRPPFSRAQYPQIEQLMEAHRSAAVPPLRQLRPDVSESLEAIILAMLAKDPRQRPESPAEVAEQLRPFTAGADLDSLLSQAEAAADLPEGDGSLRSQANHPLSQTKAWGPTAPAASETVANDVGQEDTRVWTAPAPSRRDSARRLPVGLLVAVLVLGLAGLALLAWQTSQPQPIDLLRLIDAQRDAASGEWKIEGGALRSPDAPHAMLALPHPPPLAYKLEIEARQVSGSRLAIGLVRDGQQCPVVLNTASIGDGATESTDSEQSRELAAKLGFQGGQPRTYTAIVRPEGILVAYENRIELALPAGQSPPATGDWRTANPETLFIGAHYSEYEFRQITLTPIQP